MVILCVSGYTYLTWNHPWAFVAMAGEAAVVGWLFTRRRVSLVTADALYWIILGIPLGLFCFHILSGFPVGSSLFLITKQAYNGIANALVARLIFAGISRALQAERISLRETLSTPHFLCVADVDYPGDSERQARPGPNRPGYSQVMKAGEQSVQIVSQLLAFAWKQTIAPRVLDLNETIEGMLKMLRRLIGEDIDLAWEPDTNLWPVKMDPSQIDQILANLCVNARDAISGVGKVTIETENVVLDEDYCADREGFVPGEYVMLGVSDNGCGMDKETLANAFEPFFTTKEVGRGTGLGLSTVYGIVKQNNGFVNIYSEPNKGTTFRMYLPRHGAEDEKETAEVEAAIPPGRGETVLVVEDDGPLLALARRTLENLGYEVLASANPLEAIDVAWEHEGEIHLLVTDVVLPGMSGKDLAVEIAKTRPGTRSLYMSGYTANVIAHHGVLDEGVQFIGKPFTSDSLGRKVREALGTRNNEE